MAKKQPPGRPKKPAKQKAVATAVTLPPDLLAALESRRKEKGLSRSAAVSEALRTWLGQS